MRRGRIVLLVLLPVEIVLLYWLGSTFHSYPHRFLTGRRHSIYGWIWQDVPIRVDGWWKFDEAGDSLVCRWELEAKNYSASDTVRLYRVIYSLKGRGGDELIREDLPARPAGGPADEPSEIYLVIPPARTAGIQHAFPADREIGFRVAHAHIRLSADRLKPGE
jgi:hypothetical protein